MTSKKDLKHHIKVWHTRNKYLQCKKCAFRADSVENMKKLHKPEECSLWSDWGIFKRIQIQKKERKEKRKIEEEKELKKKIETERRKAFFKIDENKEKKGTEELKTSSKLDKNKKKKTTRSSKRE